MQRTKLRTILSHSCGVFRVFFATPVINEPGGERLNCSLEEVGCQPELRYLCSPKKEVLIWRQLSLLRNTINTKQLH